MKKSKEKTASNYVIMQDNEVACGPSNLSDLTAWLNDINFDACSSRGSFTIMQLTPTVLEVHVQQKLTISGRLG